MSEIQEVISKIKKTFEKLKFPLEEERSVLLLHVENPKLFFHENIDLIENSFSLLESESIKVFIENEKNPFSLHAILSAKSLQIYINLVRDQEFFDIINNQSVTSHFQPIVDMKTKGIYGYEALIRGVNKKGELIYPDELFSKSKRNDMNFRLDRLCRESALKTSAVKKIKHKVFINFLPTAIYDPHFCLASTVKWANQLEFDPKNIIFEVVETEQVKDIEHLKGILKYYREQGFKVALDDVGEGYSSLNMIIDLKPDIIKVDRKIVSNIYADELKQSVYKALYNLAKENNIKVLAEGVETPYELECIKSIGVDYVQGYYIAKPQAEPIRELDEDKL
jgi:EAL domain-containing protein (putative c-di-GMP-specific phosphodiesterase class I)